MTRQTPFALTVVALLVAACGGSTPEATSGTPPAGQSVVVATSPVEADVDPDGTIKFGAQVTGTANPSVTWQVVEPDGGTVDATGLYTAPAAEGTFHVQAISAATAAATSSSVVKVRKRVAAPRVAISILPTSATLDACAGQVFTATVTNAANTAVTWTVLDAGGGTVSAGSYVAPSVPGTYRVMAASQADPTRTVVATVTVGPEKILSVRVTPGSGTVVAGGALALAATVTTSCGAYAAP